MNDPSTPPEKRRDSDLDLAEIQRLLNGKKSISPSCFDTFGKFSRQFLCESVRATTEHYLRFASRFSPVSAFVAIA
jgi:hypothetical protein